MLSHSLYKFVLTQWIFPKIIGILHNIGQYVSNAIDKTTLFAKSGYSFWYLDLNGLINAGHIYVSDIIG